MDQQQPPPPPPQEPPPQQPQWAPPPQQQPGWGSPGMAPPERPMGVTLASIFLIVMGVLWLLGGAACAIGGGAIGGLDIPEMPGGVAGAVGGVVLVLGIIALALGVVHIAAGAGAISGKAWGRMTAVITAIALAIIFGLLGLGGLGQDVGGAILWIVFAVLYGLSAWALIQAGPYFAYRR